PATSTGLVQLDRVLNGGLRGGDLIALSGAAKAGKSTLAGQIA
ncbi:MAG: DNA repair protein RadA, partial [Sandaracinaceae bacterium]|nr:DNA repair protein RadA [Sandaracinaceae bacterium]